MRLTGQGLWRQAASQGQHGAWYKAKPLCGTRHRTRPQAHPSNWAARAVTCVIKVDPRTFEISELPSREHVQ